MGVKSKDGHCITQKDTQPSQIALEDSSKRSFMLFVVVSLQLGSIIQSNLISLSYKKTVSPVRFVSEVSLIRSFLLIIIYVSL